MRGTILLRRPSSFLSALATHKPSSLALSSDGAALTYGQVTRLALSVGAGLDKSSSRSSSESELPAERLAFLTPPTCLYASTLLSAWVAGHIAVPLSPLYPPSARGEIVNDCAPSTLVTAEPYSAEDVQSPHDSSLPPMACLSLSLSGDLNEISSRTNLNDPHKQLTGVAENVRGERPAMLIYTSGTTGAPKGVVWTHSMIDYQVSTLSKLWRWSNRDRILNVLPLHHVHGIVNVLLSALYSGAHCEMMEKFSARDVWVSFCSAKNSPTVFMAVPTIYQRLIRFYDDAADADRSRMRKAASRLRLFVCGSAALSPSDVDAWERISGHRILERYGMTETGMLLANGFDERQPASLGTPLPGVETKVVSDDGEEVIAGQGTGIVEGVLCVRGAGVFSEYWKRADETLDAFDDEDWFYTGDVVRMETQSGRCSMLGRESVDFVHTGGYKVSALEIESALLQHEHVATCAVVRVDDEELGEAIACVAVAKNGVSSLSASQLHDWLAERLPLYKVPRRIHIVREDFLPRNALGKVQKKVLSKNLMAKQESRL